jgi:hypothetical protein
MKILWAGYYFLHRIVASCYGVPDYGIAETRCPHVTNCRGVFTLTRNVLQLKNKTVLRWIYK